MTDAELLAPTHLASLAEPAPEVQRLLALWQRRTRAIIAPPKWIENPAEEYLRRFPLLPPPWAPSPVVTPTAWIVP